MFMNINSIEYKSKYKIMYIAPGRMCGILHFMNTDKARTQPLNILSIDAPLSTQALKNVPGNSKEANPQCSEQSKCQQAA